ncbi:uncharacterized protein LOC103974603 isoform X1 [Musa acuminata AAA Group]|uniref:uncharacterized protein LOC103974603 isoform X1 n=1 Tax=Musa acuminata AAA Group TaxID=214697 RepID=UPI0031D86477
MKAKAGKIELEQYVHFYLDPGRSYASLAHLKQIVTMHGLNQLHNCPKSFLISRFHLFLGMRGLGANMLLCEQRHIIECLESIEMMSPARKTLEKSVTSRAFLLADEVVADLTDIGWEECHVRSLLTLDPRSGAVVVHELEVPADGVGGFSPAAVLPSVAPRRERHQRRGRSAPAADFEILGGRPRSKRKHISINAISPTSSTTAACGAVGASPSTWTSIPPPPSPQSE